MQVFFVFKLIEKTEDNPVKFEVIARQLPLTLYGKNSGMKIINKQSLRTI
jgi:hypothetical protein